MPSMYTKLTLAVAKFGLVLDLAAAPTTEISAAFRLLETFGADTDMVVEGCEFNGAALRARNGPPRNDEFGRRFFVSLIVTCNTNCAASV